MRVVVDCSPRFSFGVSVSCPCVPIVAHQRQLALADAQRPALVATRLHAVPRMAMQAPRVHARRRHCVRRPTPFPS
eukprot:11347450-Alexandrium_andersonii.AAC.1